MISMPPHLSVKQVDVSCALFFIPPDCGTNFTSTLIDK